ncbi:ABC antibiotics transporter [Streptomyces luteolifulvus]|jgi:ABC-2 type transport system permease protein|uniref:ABC antibiotics transporter n=1 Tax=Streptomyces luteolifulvus TaxID=2615112 RepID=A0A6H9V3X4_9ACTN|nr:ABC antibiotics transporter [Streptomyces luteolifulvus]KAB1149756.1 ABC antibiotics transporter [Streptomyces luteolifulvus]
MSTLTGTRELARLALRRDRVALPVWILGLSALMASFAAMTVAALRTEQDVIDETEFMAGNPALRMLGLASGPTVGGYAMIRSFATLAILAALMSVFAVVRHTRRSEATGRAELVGAAVVGRFGTLAAAVLVTVCADVLLAVFLGLGMTAAGLPAAGSFTAGAAIAAVGLVFTGVAAVTAQLSSSSRGANGLAAAALGLSFLFSGAGNLLGSVDGSGLRVVSAWPSWLSPIGWGQQMRPFGGDQWWPLAPSVAAFVALLGVAGALAGRRDFGRGLIRERRGPAHARPGLLGPLGLIRRLQRGAVRGWAVGILAFGLVFGAVSSSVEDLGGSAREWYRRMGGTDEIVDAYLTSLVSMAGMAVAVCTVQLLLRLRAEETEGPLESVLATAVGRRRWTLGQVLTTWLTAAVLLLLFALSTGLAAGQVLGDTPGRLGALAGAVLAQLPGIMVVSGCVVAAVGLLPRWAVPVSWSVLLASVLLGPLFGPTLDAPQWAQNLSAFTHVAKAPATAITAAPLTALTAVSLLLVALGTVSFRHRDLALPA